MNICVIGKVPPIQGGVSSITFDLVSYLANKGHHVSVVTNARSVESAYRETLQEEDWAFRHYGRNKNGGSLRIVDVPTPSRAYRHIPDGQPFLTQLTGVTLSVARGSDLILSYYLEPYGLAAWLAGTVLNKPYIIMHAGSDVGRLMNRSDLAPTYKAAIRGSRAIFAGLRRPFLGMGLSEDQVVEIPPRGFSSWFTSAPKQTRDGGQVHIGVYGKAGQKKGTDALLLATAKALDQGADFHLLLLGNGYDVYKSMIHELGITENVTVEPFIAPWKIPQFIDRCDAVAFLEYDFPIKFHSPGVPYEVLSRGTCLIVSNDIVGRLGEPRSAELPDQNLIEVDPRRPDSIAAAIVSICSRVENAHEIGSRGRDLADWVGDSSQWNAFVENKLQLACAPADTNHYGWSSVVGWLSRSTKADPEGMLEKLWVEWREVDAQSFPNSMVEAYAFSKYLEERALQDIGTSELKSELKLDSIRLWQFMDCQDDYFAEFDNGPDATDDQLHLLVTSHWCTTEVDGKELIFFRTPNLIQAPVFEYGPDLKALVRVCDGRTPISRIPDEIGLRSTDVTAMLQRLYDQGVIIYVRRMPDTEEN